MGDEIAVDLHVHTSRYSPCAEYLDPTELLAAAGEQGLAGVVVTEHDVLWTAEETEALQGRHPTVRLYRGIECTVAGAHLVIIGVDDAARLYRGMALADAARLAHEAGAAVILAHPFRDSDPRGLPLSLVDAVEVASTSFTAHEAVKAHRLARALRKPKVAGSDAHALSRVGWAWTAFPFLPRDERELAAAIKSGVGKVGRRGRFPRPVAVREE